MVWSDFLPPFFNFFFSLAALNVKREGSVEALDFGILHVILDEVTGMSWGKVLSVEGENNNNKEQKRLSIRFHGLLLND